MIYIVKYENIDLISPFISFPKSQRKARRKNGGLFAL